MWWIGKLAVFSFAMFLGIGAATVIARFEIREMSAELTVDEQANRPTASGTALSPTGIHVMYAGWERGAGMAEPYLKVLIHNGLNGSVAYSAHTPEGPFPELAVNGKPLQMLGRCGTGIKSFYISSGDIAELRLSKYDFLEQIGKNDKITVGYYLKLANADNFKIYTSEPFLLPDEFRESIGSWHD